MPLRTIGVFGALCLLTGWLMGSLVLPPVASLQSNPPPEPAAAAAVDASPAPVYTERLRQRLREGATTPTSRRNPFVFEQPRTAAPARAVTPETLPPPPPVEPPPAFALAGIATTDASEGAVYTAVLSTHGDVVLARVGDVLPDGTRVVSIDDAAVTLDAAGRTMVLRLK